VRAAATQRQLAQLAGVPRAKMLAYLKGTIPGTASLGRSYRERERETRHREGGTCEQASRRSTGRGAAQGTRLYAPSRTRCTAWAEGGGGIQVVCG